MLSNILKEGGLVIKSAFISWALPQSSCGTRRNFSSGKWQL